MTYALLLKSYCISHDSRHCQPSILLWRWPRRARRLLASALPPSPDGLPLMGFGGTLTHVCTHGTPVQELLVAATMPPLPPDVLEEIDKIHQRSPNPTP